MLLAAYSPSHGASIEINKRIPLASGLGGDSSDAVAVLRGLNMLWKLGLASPELLNLAAGLGSDLPLFVHGGTMLVEGRGEKVTPLPPAPHCSAVLLFPPLPAAENKTARMYGLLQAADYTDGSFTHSLAAAIRHGRGTFGRHLYNAFEPAGLAFFNGLRRYRAAFRVAGARDIHLAGAGPTLYTIVRERARADMVCQRLRECGLDACVAEF
jgi:4-diphosphocytidyl-2-C-methyl-D-erythritol kinase